MSLIVAEVYDALIEAGTSDEKAKAAAGALPIAERLATKEDLDDLRAATKEDLDDLRRQFNDLRGQFNDLKGSINERFAKIERDLALLKFGYGPVVLALLVKIAFF